MDSRSSYRLQLMEKLGAPLLRALPAGMDGEKAAETVAALVAKSVQASLVLSQSMKLSDEDGNIDSIRLSLAALAAPLLADSYQALGKIPDDAAIEKLGKGLEATLVFAENFNPAIEHAARLKSLHEPLPVIDSTQVALLTLNALVPCVQAVHAFSYGQNETTLIKEIAERLQKTATQLSDASVKGDDGDRAFGRLMVMRALAEIYAGCHRRVLETHRGSDAPSLAPVWQAYDEQVAMLLALSGAAVPTQSQAPAASSSESSGAAPMGFFKKPDEAQAPTTPPPPAPEAPPSSPAASGSPMSFFKPGTKKAEGEE